MTTENLPQPNGLLRYVVHALSGLGILYIFFLMGWVDLNATAVRITTEQASQITDDTISGGTLSKGRK